MENKRVFGWPGAVLALVVLICSGCALSAAIPTGQATALEEAAQTESAPLVEANPQSEDPASPGPSTPQATQAILETAAPTTAQPTAPVGRVLYISPTGDDQNTGSEDQPWRTVQKAAETLNAGDTVYIRTGTYHEQVIPRNSGAAGQFITFAAYPGEAVTLDGAGVDIPEWNGLVYVIGREYIRISGLRVINAETNPHNPGILVEESRHIVIEDNFVTHSSDSGIAAWNSVDVTVARNEVDNPCTAAWNESISIGGTDQFQVIDNHVHDSIKEGICIKHGSVNGEVFGNHVHHTSGVGIYVDAWDTHTHDIRVYQNMVHDISGDGIALASESGGLLENISVFNNLSYHNQYIGISTTINGPGGPQGEHPMKNIQIVNNTIYHNGWEVYGGGIVLDNPWAENVLVRNNICSQSFYFQLVASPAVPATSYTIDHNLIDGFNATEGEIWGDDALEGDPRFLDPAAGDFHLDPRSPAVNAGAAQGAPAVDFEGDARPQGSGMDIGWDEIVE